MGFYGFIALTVFSASWKISLALCDLGIAVKYTLSSLSKIKKRRRDRRRFGGASSARNNSMKIVNCGIIGFR